jgi:hypothetical protein
MAKIRGALLLEKIISLGGLHKMDGRRRALGAHHEEFAFTVPAHPVDEDSSREVIFLFFLGVYLCENIDLLIGNND